MSELTQLSALPEDFVKYLQSVNGGRCDQIKRLSVDLYAATKPLLYHWTLIIGVIGERGEYLTRFCYESQEKANQALADWDGTGEPSGWHRHPDTGRRRTQGNPMTEYLAP